MIYRIPNSLLTIIVCNPHASMGLIFSHVGGGARRVASHPQFAPRVRTCARQPDRTFSCAAAALEHLDAEVAAIAARDGVDPHRALAAVCANPRLLVSPSQLVSPWHGGGESETRVNGVDGVEGVKCDICRDGFDATDDAGLLVGSCGHRCHSACVAHLVRSYAGQARPLPYPCPHLGCPGVVERAAMDAVGTEGVAARPVPRAYAACPTPGCAAYVLPSDPDDLLPGGAVRCGACDAVFCHACRFHAHPAVGCAELRSVVDALMVPVSDLAIRFAVRAEYDGKLPPLWFAEELAMVGCEPAAWVAPDPRGRDVVAEARELIATSLDDDVPALPELACLAGIELAPRFCPNCFVTIVRVDGCVAMVCSACRHAFCYECLGPVHCHGISCTRSPDVPGLVRRAALAGVSLGPFDAVTMVWGELDVNNVSSNDRQEHERAIAMARMRRGARLDVIRMTATGATGATGADGADGARDALVGLLAKERAWRAAAALEATLDSMRKAICRATRRSVVERVLSSARDRMYARFNALLGRDESDALVRHIPRLLTRPRMDVPVFGDVMINVDAGYMRRFGNDPMRGGEEVVYVPTDDARRRAERLTSAMFRAFFALASTPSRPFSLERTGLGLAAVFHALHAHAHAFGLSNVASKADEFGVLALPDRATDARDRELFEAFLVARLEHALGRAGARVFGPPSPSPSPSPLLPTVTEDVAAVLRAIEGIALPSEDDFLRACVAHWLYGGDPPETWYLEERALGSSGYFLLDSPALAVHTPPSAPFDAFADGTDAWFRRPPGSPFIEDVDLGAPPTGFRWAAEEYAVRAAGLRRQRVVRESAVEAEAKYECGPRSIRDREANLRALLHARGFVKRARDTALLEFEAIEKNSVVVKRAQELREKAHASAIERILGDLGDRRRRSLTPDEIAWFRPHSKLAARDAIRVGATVTVVADYKNVEHDDAALGPLAHGATGIVAHILTSAGLTRAKVSVATFGGVKSWWYNLPALVVVRGVDNDDDVATELRDGVVLRNVAVLRRGWTAMQVAVVNGVTGVTGGTGGEAAALAPLVRQLHYELLVAGDMVHANHKMRAVVHLNDLKACTDMSKAYVAHLVERIEAALESA